MYLRGNEIMYLISSMGGKAHTLEHVYQMAENVDYDILVKAVEKVNETYPMFASALRMSSDGRFCVEKTDAPVPVFTNGNSKCLGSDETNGYMYKVCCVDQTIEFDIMHALTDGRGALLYSRAVIYMYLRYKYDISRDDAFEEEVLNFKSEDVQKVPFDYIVGEGIDCKDILRSIANENQIEDCVKLNPTESSDCEERYIIEYDNDTLVEKAKNIGASVVTLIMSVMEKSIAEVVDVGEKNIVVSVPVELRSRFGVKSQANYSTGAIQLSYTKEDNDNAVEEIAKDSRAKIKAMDIKSAGIADVVKNSVGEAAIEKMPFNNRDMVNMITGQIKNTLSPQTFTASDVGRIVLSECMEKYVVSVMCYVRMGIINGCGMGLYSYKNVGQIDVLFSSEYEFLINRFSENITKLGINNQIKHLMRTDADTFYLDRVMEA